MNNLGCYLHAYPDQYNVGIFALIRGVFSPNRSPGYAMTVRFLYNEDTKIKFTKGLQVLP